ncbi:hypothetical protein MXD63_44800, partial [Frankia sp. Cpl3]|nr:hypothetical protein [Frankia sp. Cpl3]
MKKALGLFAMGFLAVSLAACGTGPKEQASGSAPTEQKQDANAKVFKLGITQFVEHPALDSVHKGIVDGLAEAGYQ